MSSRRPDQLDAMLAEARSGGQLDSEGSFTIAGEAAIGKLAAFQLPRVTAWILKMVQGAVVSQAPELRIRQSHEATTFEFSPVGGFQLEELRRSLLSPQISGEGAERHLAIGLRAVGFADKRAFTLALDQEGTRTILGWNGQKLVQRAEPHEGEVTRLQIGVAFPEEDKGRQLGGLMKSSGRATAEYKEVVLNAEVCPIPLTFDGRRIDRIEAPPSQELAGKMATLSLGWPALKQDEASFGRPQGIATNLSGWRPTDRFTDSRVFFSLGDLTQERVNSMVRLRYHYDIVSHRSKHKSFQFRNIPRASFCLWIRDGVICHRERADVPVRAVSYDLYLPGDGLPTDISGLTLRPGEEQALRLRQAQEHLRWQVEETLDKVKSHTPKPFGVHVALSGAMGVMGLLATPTTFGKSALAGFALLNMAISAYYKSKVMDDCAHHLVRLRDSLGSGPQGLQFRPAGHPRY